MAKDKKTGELAALKIYRFPDDDYVTYEADFMREIELLASLHHPCFVDFKRVLNTKKKLQLAYATEYLVNGRKYRRLWTNTEVHDCIWSGFSNEISPQKCEKIGFDHAP